MNHDQILLQSLRASVLRLRGSSSDDLPEARSCLTRIADASRDLSADYRRRHPSIPWLVLAEMGAVIRRAGDDLDPREVLATLRQDIPELQQRLASL